MDLSNAFDALSGAVSPQAAAFLQVVLIDLTLAGDNAIVIGLAAAGLPKEQRGKAVLAGIIAATVMRIAFALVTTTLLQIVGLLLAGGILLLWVCWKMWRELRRPQHADRGADVLEGHAPSGGPAKPKTMRAAITQIVVADISMSLDNVLAVAGAAHEHPAVLVFGLSLSVLLMGVAATFIARLLERRRWIAYAGLAVIFFVALEMIWRGAEEVYDAAVPEEAGQSSEIFAAERTRQARREQCQLAGCNRSFVLSDGVLSINRPFPSVNPKAHSREPSKHHRMEKNDHRQKNWHNKHSSPAFYAFHVLKSYSQTGKNAECKNQKEGNPEKEAFSDRESNSEYLEQRTNTELAVNKSNFHSPPPILSRAYIGP